MAQRAQQKVVIWQGCVEYGEVHVASKFGTCLEVNNGHYYFASSQVQKLFLLLSFAGSLQVSLVIYWLAEKCLREREQQHDSQLLMFAQPNIFFL